MPGIVRLFGGPLATDLVKDVGSAKELMRSKSQHMSVNDAGKIVKTEANGSSSDRPDPGESLYAAFRLLKSVLNLSTCMSSYVMLSIQLQKHANQCLTRCYAELGVNGATEHKGTSVGQYELEPVHKMMLKGFGSPRLDRVSGASGISRLSPPAGAAARHQEAKPIAGQDGQKAAGEQEGAGEAGSERPSAKMRWKKLGEAFNTASTAVRLIGAAASLKNSLICMD